VLGHSVLDTRCWIVLGGWSKDGKDDRNSDKNEDGQISYKEFLEAFRQETEAIADNIAFTEESTHDVGYADLVGLEAKIPGGRYDSDLSPSLKIQADRYKK
jgi:hypothetical protein